MEVGVESCLRIRYVKACDLAENAENPCSQNADQDIALDVLDDQNGCDDNADKSEKHGDAFRMEGSFDNRAVKGK